MGTTISRIIHYLILLIGFLVGLGVFGIELSKLTVVFGALGVGIGFGLQSVVNNIVSGLILLFTRPINVDDTIEVGNIMGEIKQIGIRSSILRTRQGADIIIPNADLTGGQVINWTYSDKRRRIELPVGVNYGSEPRKVIEMITAVASAHPRVLRYPPPQTFLTEFGDSSINYELRVWTDDALNWYIIRSELAVAIYDAIHASGMVIPFPQREVRLLKDNEA
ncbi:MAG: mechanosensitive ion channel family protein [Desulfobacteraceae bacterium]|nr:MAG: mechanosensitive ion channel family protein [Desulfobacteraceae bacterium]